MALETLPMVDATGRGVPPVWRSNRRNRVSGLPQKEFDHACNPLPTVVASILERLPAYLAAAASASVPAGRQSATIVSGRSCGHMRRR
jgi:hypothetical protein